MLKKLLKGCLTIAMVSALAIPAMADTAINGRVRAWVQNSSVKDGASLTQMNADGRFGGHVTGEAGDWTGKGLVQIGLDPDSDPDAWSMRNFTAGISNDSMDITLGRQYVFGIAKGQAYTMGFVNDSYWAGETVYNARSDFLTVKLTDLGLKIIFGMDNFGSETSDTTGDEYNMTTVGVVYSKSFGSLGLAVEYTSQGFAIDKEYGDSTEKGADDGRAVSDLAVAVDFAISDAMTLAFNYDMATDQSGVSGSDAEVSSSMEFWFDMGLGDGLGLSVGYGMKGVAVGSADPTNSTMTNLGFTKAMGMMKAGVGYIAKTSKNDATGLDSGDSKIAFGFQAGFK
jgi:hypothetical protein